MNPRALALLAGFASPVFLIAAVAGWLAGIWPANPFTLGIAAAAVIAGPLLGMLHVATAETDRREPDDAVTMVATIAPEPILTPKAASAKAFQNWRDSSNPTISRRERERRASQYIRA